MQKKTARLAGRKLAPKARRQVRVRRKRRTSQDILDRIVQAARAEFKRAGFAGATTARIARGAAVAEAQIFQYFGSKANLFRETVFKPLDQQLQGFNDRHMADHKKGMPLREMASLYTTDLQRFINDNCDTLTSLVVAQTYSHGTAGGVGAINSLKTYFDRGAATMTRKLKRQAKVAPELMVRVSFAAVLACIMFRDWIFTGDLGSDEQIRNAINDFVLEGIGANIDLRDGLNGPPGSTIVTNGGNDE